MHNESIFAVGAGDRKESKKLRVLLKSKMKSSIVKDSDSSSHVGYLAEGRVRLCGTRFSIGFPKVKSCLAACWFLPCI